MQDNFRISLESPQCGWISVGLLFGDEIQARFAAWHEPFHPLEDLLRHVAAAACGAAGESVVQWNCAPEQYDWEIASDGIAARLRVVRYADARRESGSVIFTHTLTPQHLGRLLCDEARELQARAGRDQFTENWRRPFPDEQLRHLDAACAVAGEV